MAKRALTLVDNDSLDVHAILLVDNSISEGDVKEVIEKVKSEKSGWQISDIVEAIPVEFEDLEYDIFYI